MIHKDVHQTHIASGQNLRLRSGIYFSDDGTRAVGMLRSNDLATSDKPWAEVAFDRSAGFEFRYRQTGRVKHSESARWVSACIETVPETVPTTCSMPSDSDTGEADKWRRYENASTVDLETIHPPSDGQLPWAELADHALVAIDFRGNEVSRLSKRLVELNWMDEAEVSASGGYEKEDSLQCEDGEMVSRTITQTASANTLAGWERSGPVGPDGTAEPIRLRETFFLDGSPVYAGPLYEDGWSASVTDGQAGGTGVTTTTWDPPGQNPESTRTDEYAFSFAGELRERFRMHLVDMAGADLRSGFLVFTRFEENYAFDQSVSSSGDFESSTSRDVGTETMDNIYRTQVVVDGSLVWEHTEAVPLINRTFDDTGERRLVHIGSYSTPMRFSSPPDGWGVMPSIGCGNSSPPFSENDYYYDAGGNPVSWDYRNFGHLHSVRIARHGAHHAFALLHSKFAGPPPPSYPLTLQLGDDAYGDLIAHPPSGAFHVERLTVF